MTQFLFESLSKDKRLISKFYWNVNVETENEIKEISDWYKNLNGSFCEKVKLTGDDSLFKHLINHISIREILSEGFQKCISKKEKVEESANKIRDFFSKKKANEIKETLQSDFFLFGSNEVMKSFVAEGTKVFGSNTRPIKL